MPPYLKHRPSQDQHPKLLTWPDPNTGLEWQLKSPGLMTWFQAVDYAASLSLAGKTD